MASFNSGKSDEEHSDMSDGAVIGCGLQSDDRRILHGESQQSRKDTFRASSTVITSFKGFRSVVDRCSDIGIASEIGGTAFAFKEFWMEPRAERMCFGEFFRMGYRANELQSDFASIFEFAPINHIETGNTHEVASGRKFDFGMFLPARIAGYSREGF